MRRYLFALFLASLAVLGGKNALASVVSNTYALSFDGYAPAVYFPGGQNTAPYGYRSSNILPAGTYEFNCASNCTDGEELFTSTSTGTAAPGTYDIENATEIAVGLYSVTIPNPWRTISYNWNVGAPNHFLDGSEITYITGDPAQIDFSQPTNGVTIADFDTWKLRGAMLDTSGTLYRYDVIYSQAGGSATYDDFNLGNSYYSYAELDIPKTHLLDLGGTTGWYAQGFLFATSSTDPLYGAMNESAAIAATNPITFDINASSTGGPLFGNGTSTVGSCGTSTAFFEFTGSAPFFQINNPIPSIQVGACEALNAVFSMNSDQSSDINARYAYAKNMITTKPPFGYFTLITGAFGSFQSGSSTINLMSASSTAALSPIFLPLDTGLAAAVGLVGGFWLLRRLKHIQP
jgi:hypothetical protein